MDQQPIVIANTTPIINFAQIERLDILADLFGRIVIPQAVADELESKRELFPLAAAACDASIIEIRQARDEALINWLTLEIHRGEAACLEANLN